jgi:hypothetical protein
MGTVVKIYTGGIYVVQNPRCELWKACRRDGRSFYSVCHELGFNWTEIKKRGFNRNFLTRARWLDVSVFVNHLHVLLPQLIIELEIEQDQVDSWKLTVEERARFYPCSL